MGRPQDEESGDQKSRDSNLAAAEEPKTFGEKLKRVLRNNLLVVLLIIALILGIGIGALMRLRDEPYSKRELMYLRFPGELLMNMLQLLILPLIVSSLVSGMTSLDTRASGR
jgi:L-cystine uptake protein TcyP (sodium:dicarboxylate symporter family)